MKTKFNLDKLIDFYLHGQSTRQVAKEIGCSQNTVVRLLKEHNILRRKPSSHRTHTFNYNYFDLIDTEEKAYFLGLLWADGFCDKNTGNIVISLQEEDGYILERFKDAVGFSGDITKILSNIPNRKPLCKFQMFSKQMAEVLDSYGMVKAKSLTLQFPTVISEHLVHHFIRGYFDGDGSVYINKRKEMGIGIVGTELVLSTIKKYINDTSGYNIGCLCDKRKNKYPIKQLMYSGSNSVLIVKEYLYKEASIYLTRKYNKFKDIIIKRKRTFKGEAALYSSRQLELNI